MQESNYDIDDLIGRVLAGEADLNDRRKLDAWLALDPSNKEYYSQLETIFEKAAGNTVQLEFDTDAAWKKVKHQMKDSDVRRLVPQEAAANFSVLRMAASIALILGIGFFAYRWFDQPT